MDYIRNNKKFSDFSCPHCDEGISLDYYPENFYEGEMTDNCPHCQRKVTINIEIIYKVRHTKALQKP